MRVITYLEIKDDSVYVSIYKKNDIEHKYLLMKGSPSFIRFTELVESYATKAYMRFYPNGIFSVMLDGSPYGEN